MRIARRLLGSVLFVAFLVLGWRLAAENGEVVTVHYLSGEFTGVPLWAVLLISFGGGGVLAGLVGLYRLAKLGLVTRGYRKTVRGLEAEVHQLRNLPLSIDDSAPGDSVAAATGALPGALERSA